MDAAVASATPEVEPEDESEGPPGAAVVLGVLLVATAALLLFGLARSRWFYQDEWDFLVARQAGNLGDLFRPHNEHWSTLPILVYRLLFNLFGLRTYVPYQAVVVLAHVAVVALLWVVMRRSGVHRWLALAAVVPLLLFGSGQEDIVFAFQIGFVGSMAFGLAQLVLADHDGAWDRRDWLGLAAGLAALLCSGVGVTMVIVVGMAALARRSWRIAAAHTVPLGTIYLVWFWIERPGTAFNPDHRSTVYIAGQMLRFDLHGLLATFRALGYFPIVGVALAVALVAGLALGIRRVGARQFLQVRSMPLALLAGMVVLLTITSWGRWTHGPAYAAQSRYVYLTAAMVLPSLGVAADELRRRSWWPAAVVVVLLAVGIPGNVAEFGNGQYLGSTFTSYRQLTLSLPRSPLAAQVPPGTRPDPFTALDLTLGWLQQQQARGRLTDPGPVPYAVSSQVPVRLGFRTALYPVKPKACQAVPHQVILNPPDGAHVVMAGAQAAVSAWVDGRWSTPVPFNAESIHLYLVQLPHLRLRLTPARRGDVLELCR